MYREDPSPAASRYTFRLFVAGESLRSRQAVANLKRLAEERLGGRYDLTVIDVITDPEGAEAARVLTDADFTESVAGAGTTCDGDLTDVRQVIMALGLDDDPHFKTE